MMPCVNYRWNFRLLSMTVCLALQIALVSTNQKNMDFEGYQTVNLRRARSHPDNEYVPPDALMSSKVDAALLDNIGGEELSGSVERKRRDRGGVDAYAQRIESDAIAAAAESAAAEADAVAAAVEAVEVEKENHARSSGGRGGRFSDDSEMTFEESDNGDNVVVVQNDVREDEHLGRGAGVGTQNFQTDHSASQFDVRDNQHRDTGAAVSHATNVMTRTSSQNQNYGQAQAAGSSISSSSSSNTAYDSSNRGSSDIGGYADVQAPLQALLTESSDLAKEIRLVFQVLAKREDYLVQEMEKLKMALQNAIQVLQENNKEFKLSRKRRDNGDSNPYKACVYITPPNGQDQNANFAPPQALLQTQSYYDTDSDDSSNQSGDEVDLSSVYWLKLPENADEGILERVHSVLTGVRDSGRDVLLIPVSKSYMSKQDVAKGFLKAVRINPTYTTSTDSKQRRRRRKLRLRIRRI